MCKFNLWNLLACVAGLIAIAGRVEAANYQLSDLLAGGSFQSGDKRFSNFRNFIETGGQAPLGAANILLTPISQPNQNLADPTNWPLPPGQPACGNPCPTEYGFRLSADWDLTPAQDYFLGLDYQVTSLECGMYASQIELAGAVINGDVDVSQSLTFGPQTLAINSVWIQDPGSNKPIDRKDFVCSLTGLPLCVSSAEVSLGLQLQAYYGFGSHASAQHIDLYYAQASPEPSTYALLVLGSAGVGLMVRRKRA
jgi:hypothetical protein